MSPETFIFIGRSGSGKGTQAPLLIEELKRRDPARPVFYLEMGARFREFFAATDPESAYSRAIAKKITDEGRLQPAFLPVWLWAETMVRNFHGNEHLVMDGAPRRPTEPPILDSAFDFYKRERPFVIYLDLEHGAAAERLLKRGRYDDTHEAIARRMGWFESDVMPIVEYYRNNPKYRFLDIDGGKTVEEVRDQIFAAVFK